VRCIIIIIIILQTDGLNHISIKHVNIHNSSLLCDLPDEVHASLLLLQLYGLCDDDNHMVFPMRYRSRMNTVPIETIILCTLNAFIIPERVPMIKYNIIIRGVYFNIYLYQL